MFLSPSPALPHFNSVSYFGSYPFYCSTCKQRFQTEKNLKRHNSSRKHMRQMQCIDASVYQSELNNESPMKWEMLPSDVIDSLILDLAGQPAEKDDFFKDIQLVESEDLDVVREPIAVPQLQLSPHWRMECNPIVYRPKQPAIRRCIPPTYPCLTCFQSLDSQKNFDEHMLKAHFNKTFTVEKDH